MTTEENLDECQVQMRLAIKRVNMKWKVQRTGWNNYEIVERNPVSEEVERLRKTLKTWEEMKD